MTPPGKTKARPVKRGTPHTTLATTTPKPVTFLDVQPKDRYNLIFYADYSDKDAVLEATDEAFVNLYHDTFPRALDSYTAWDTKVPSSRSHCKAEKIEKVKSLLEIVRGIKDFVSGHAKDGKKLGTIILSGHGNPQEFSLPLTKPVKEGGHRLPLPDLEVGLQYADSLSEKPPSEWRSTAAKWKELKSDFMRLEVEASMLHKHLGTSWTDKETLLRCWCCRLGRQPSGPKDPLQILGRLLLGQGEFMVEAPQERSGSTHRYFTIDSTAEESVRAKLFVDYKRKDGLWHPDTIAEVESDKTGMQFLGPDLRAARGAFFGLALQPGPTPEKKNHNWTPVFYVETASKSPIYPYDWKPFSQMWRRVTVPTA
jgi:hypothetical protein